MSPSPVQHPSSPTGSADEGAVCANATSPSVVVVAPHVSLNVSVPVAVLGTVAETVKGWPQRDGSLAEEARSTVLPVGAMLRVSAALLGA